MSTKKTASQKLQQEKAVAQVADLNKPGLENLINSIKKSVATQLDGLTTDLLTQFNLYEYVTSAIEAKKEELKTLHQLEGTVEEFQGIVNNQDEWLKNKERENEQYLYDLELKRKIEKSNYEFEFSERKKRDENELAKKWESLYKAENDINAKANELESLRNQVAEFPNVLKKALDDQEVRLVADLSLNHTFETKLLKKEYESQIALLTHANENLKAKVKECEQTIAAANSIQKDAVLRVQDIAAKAIEGASKQSAFVFPSGQPQNSQR